MRWAIVIVTAMILMLSGTSYATELTIGLIPEQNIFKQQERYKPLAEYIEKKTGIKIRITILSRYGNIIERFSADNLDGAFFGSFTGALAMQRLDIEPLARPVNLDGTSTYRGCIFVRKDSGIKTVSEMKGKRLAFVEKATTAGYVYPMAYFREQGIKDIGAYFKEYYFAGSHDAAIYAVLNKKADVGCAKCSMFDLLVRDAPRVAKELVVLVKSSEVPSNGLCVRKGLDASVKKQLKDALLGMHKDPEGRNVIRNFEAVRFIQTTKDDYQPVFELAGKAGIDIRTYKYSNK